MIKGIVIIIAQASAHVCVHGMKMLAHTLSSLRVR